MQTQTKSQNHSLGIYLIGILVLSLTFIQILQKSPFIGIIPDQISMNQEEMSKNLVTVPNFPLASAGIQIGDEVELEYTLWIASPGSGPSGVIDTDIPYQGPATFPTTVQKGGLINGFYYAILEMEIGATKEFDLPPNIDANGDGIDDNTGEEVLSYGSPSHDLYNTKLRFLVTVMKINGVEETPDFLIEFPDDFSSPLTTSSINISWSTDIHALADNFTLLTSNVPFTYSQLRNGDLPWEDVKMVFIDNSIPRDNWCNLTDLQDGIYYIGMCYTDGYDSGVSNVLELSVKLADTNSTWSVPQDFAIYFDGAITLPLKVNMVTITWLNEIFANAQNLTIYLSLEPFSVEQLKMGSVASLSFSTTVFSTSTPGMINRYQFTGLLNGTYFFAVSYANPLGQAFSNVLQITVELDPKDVTRTSSPTGSSENPFENVWGSIPGYDFQWMLLGGLIGSASIFITRSKKFKKKLTM